ncbi:MAG: hypothetical protein PHD70_12175 [Anaerostipes sp.]|nr:hypothetical protein [Anaerostipes sp.]
MIIGKTDGNPRTYFTGYYNVVCNEENNQEQIDKPADLDSHLFTPRKSSGDEVKYFFNKRNGKKCKNVL